MGFLVKKPLLTKSYASFFMGVAIATSAISMSNVAMAAPDWSKAPVSRLIVKFKSTTGATVQSRGAMTRSVLTIAAEKSGASLSTLRSMANGAQVVSLGSNKSMAEAQNVLKYLVTDPSIEYAELDLLMVPMAAPNDPMYSDQWHYFETTGGLNVESAWDLGEGEGAVVAVLDTGYRPHVDLVGNILPGYDFISDASMGNDGDGRDGDATDTGDAMAVGDCGSGFPSEEVSSSWHGTHVAGTIAAIANNDIGVTGVAPKAKIVPVRVLGKCGGYTSDIIDAVLWASGITVEGVPANENPADIINMSLGSPVPASCSQSYSNAIADARNAGSVVVIAAGNSDANADTYPPGNCPGAFTVAANNRSGGRAYYSNFGSVVDVAAPGGAQFFANDSDGVLSTSNAGADGATADNYLYYQGTSMATPHVVGVAALLFGAKSDITVEEVEDAMRTSARAFPASCTGCGTGIVDANQALNLVLGYVQPVDRANLALTLVGDNGKFKKSADDPDIGTIQYIATVTNNGIDVASNVVLETVFPADVTSVTTISDSVVCDVAAETCQVGVLSVGDSSTVTFVVITANKKSMSFTGSVSSELLDPDTSDNIVIKKFGGALGAWMLLMFSVVVMRRRIK
jgi:serine protease